MAEGDFSVVAYIKADTNNFESGIKKAQKASKSFSSSITDVINKVGKNGLVTSIANLNLAIGGLKSSFSVVIKFAQSVGKAIGECTEAYKEQLIVERALDIAIQNNPFVTGETSAALKDFASEIQRVTNYGDEQLIPMMTNLISLGRTESETMKIISVAMDMATGMGISFDAAVSQLNATLNGNIGRLGQQVAELKDLTDEELKSGKAIEILGQKFKGLSSATADTSIQLKNIKGDFKEAIGEFTLPSSDMWNKFWSGFYARGIDVINQIDSYLDAKIIGKKLVGAITEQISYIDAGDIAGRIDYIKDVLKIVNNEELIAIKNYLEGLKSMTSEEELLYKRIQSEIGAREEAIAQEKRQAEENAKLKREEEERLARLKKEEEERLAREKELAEIEKKNAEERAKALKLQKEWEDKLFEIRIEILEETREKELENEELTQQQKIEIDSFYADMILSMKLKQIEKERDEVLSQENLTGEAKEAINLYYEDRITQIINDENKKRLKIQEEEEENLRKSFIKSLKSYHDDLKKNVNDWNNVISSFGNSAKDIFSDAFSSLGEELVGAGKGFEDFGQNATKAVAGVLKALGEQLLALSAAKVLTKEYGAAIAGAAAAAAAFAAAGALESLSDASKEISENFQSVSNSFEEISKRLKEIRSVINIKQYASGWLELSQMYDSISKLYVSENVGGRQSEIDNTTRRIREIASQTNKSFSEVVSILQSSSSSSFTDQIVKSLFTGGMNINEYDKLYNILESYRAISNQIKNYLSDFNRNVKDAIKLSKDTVNLTDYIITEQSEIMENIQTSLLYSNLEKIKQSFEEVGSAISNIFVEGIINGLGKDDLEKNLKKYIRENLLKVAIYTEEYIQKMSELSARLAKAMTLKDFNQIKELKNEIKDFYKTVKDSTKEIDDMLGDIFEDTIDENLDKIENSLTRFEQLIKDFKDTISDLGGDIGSTLVDGIENGLSQSDFLDNMKKWIRKMLIQSVVYTESMKAEIEAIGQAITKGIREGFSETSLHEIRRDLSWVFNEANRTIESLDTLLDSTFSGYATGTNNATRGLHIVGESGPELVRFNGGEQVLNAMNTQKALESSGGTTINQNVTFNNIKDTSAFAMMQQFKQYNRQMAINGVI